MQGAGVGHLSVALAATRRCSLLGKPRNKDAQNLGLSKLPTHEFHITPSIYCVAASDADVHAVYRIDQILYGFWRADPT